MSDRSLWRSPALHLSGRAASWRGMLRVGSSKIVLARVRTRTQACPRAGVLAPRRESAWSDEKAARAGLAAARSRGAKLGRPCCLAPAELEMARTLRANPMLSARQVAAQLGVHRTTLYRSLARQA